MPLKPLQQTILTLFSEIRRISGDDHFSLEAAGTDAQKIALAISKSGREPQEPYANGMFQAEWNIAATFLEGVDKNYFVRLQYLAGKSDSLRRWAAFIEPTGTRDQEVLLIQNDQSKALGEALIPFLTALPNDDHYASIPGFPKDNLRRSVELLRTRIDAYNQAAANPVVAAPAMPPIAPTDAATLVAGPALANLSLFAAPTDIAGLTSDADANIQAKTDAYALSSAAYATKLHQYTTTTEPTLNLELDHLQAAQAVLRETITQLDARPRRVIPTQDELSRCLGQDTDRLLSSYRIGGIPELISNAQIENNSLFPIPRGPLQLATNKIMAALREKVDLIQGNIDLVTQGLDNERKSVALSQLKVRQDKVDLALAGLQKRHIVDLTVQYTAIQSIRLELQHLLTDIATKTPQTALIDIDRKRERIAQLTTMIAPLRASYTQIQTELAEKISALEDIEAQLVEHALNDDAQSLHDKASRMRATIDTLSTTLTGTCQRIDGLEELGAALTAKKQTLMASPQVLLAPITREFFGEDHQQNTGRFHRYLEERKNTYFWKDFFAKFASLFLGCIGYKTEREKREELVRDIKSALIAYEANPNTEKLDSIKAKIAQGIQFNKRVPNDHEHFSKTLASHLKAFQHDLAAIEARLHPQVPIAAAQTEEPNTPDPTDTPITPQA